MLWLLWILIGFVIGAISGILIIFLIFYRKNKFMYHYLNNMTEMLLKNDDKEENDKE